jgi:hypothetical protein
VREGDNHQTIVGYGSMVALNAGRVEDRMLKSWKTDNRQQTSTHNSGVKRFSKEYPLPLSYGGIGIVDIYRWIVGLIVL